MGIRETHHRIEIYLPRGEAMAEELLAEAERRGVSPAQHIKDLLMARYLARHTDTTLADLLWTPAAPASAAPAPEPPPPPPDDEPPPAAGAAKAKGMWGRKK